MSLSLPAAPAVIPGQEVLDDQAHWLVKGGVAGIVGRIGIAKQVSFIQARLGLPLHPTGVILDECQDQARADGTSHGDRFDSLRPGNVCPTGGMVIVYRCLVFPRRNSHRLSISKPTALGESTSSLSGMMGWEGVVGVWESRLGRNRSVPGLIKPLEAAAPVELISAGLTPKWMATTSRLSPDWEM